MLVTPNNYTRGDSRVSTMGAGIVSGKVVLDREWIEECMRNAEDHSRDTYPGGAHAQNHDMMPGYLSMGFKHSRGAAGNGADWNELGIAAVSGIDTQAFSSQRSMEGQFYCQGVATTEQRMSEHHMDHNSHDPNNGLYSIARVGMVNTPNNGPFMCYAGQLAAWRMPPSKRSTGNRYAGDLDPNVAGVQLNDRARNGDSNTGFRFELVPFDHTDFSLNIAGALVAMDTTSNDLSGAGIANVKFSDFYKYEGADVPSLSCEQEQAGGRKYGTCGIGLAFVETLMLRGLIQVAPGAAGINTNDSVGKQVMQLANAIGLWDTDTPVEQIPGTAWYQAVQNAFVNDSMMTADTLANKQRLEADFGADFNRISTSQSLDNDPDLNYKRLRIHLSRFTDGALAGAWYDKTSKIIGRFANTTAPGDVAHVLLGHTAI